MCEQRRSLARQVKLYMTEVEKLKERARRLPENEITERLAELNTEAREFVLTRVEQMLLDDQQSILLEAMALSDSPLSEKDMIGLEGRLRQVKMKRSRMYPKDLPVGMRARLLQEERQKLGLPPERKAS